MWGETLVRVIVYTLYYLPALLQVDSIDNYFGTNQSDPHPNVSDLLVTHNDQEELLSESSEDLRLPRRGGLALELEKIVIPADGNHTSTIIFLHGLGDTGHGWAEEIATIKPSNSKLICPTAPFKPISINGGAEMPAWYDIKTLTVKGHEDEEGIDDTVATIETMIQKEIESGIPPTKILLAGFSQGGAMALYLGLTGKYRIGGVVSMSGYLPLSDQIDWESTHKPPILQCHGDMDPIVNYRIALATMSKVPEYKFPQYIFKLYQGLDHSASAEELDDIRLFFHYILA